MAILEENADGSIIVKLSRAVRMDNGEEISRVTIPAITGAHLMHAPFTGGDVPLGQIVTFAARIVQPAGAVEKMRMDDALACARALGEAMGKSRGDGVDSLPSLDSNSRSPALSS
jgi:hypothetical protein